MNAETAKLISDAANIRAREDAMEVAKSKLPEVLAQIRAEAEAGSYVSYTSITPPRLHRAISSLLTDLGFRCRCGEMYFSDLIIKW